MSKLSVFFVACSLVIGFHSVVFSQVHETFSGTSFNETGLWSGDLTHFIVNAANQGQLNAPDKGVSYFSTPFTWLDSTSLSFYCKLEFNPSADNQVEIFLLNNSSDLNEGSGLFMSIGESLDQDGISLNIRDDEGTITEIDKSGLGVFGNGVDGLFEGKMTSQIFELYYTPAGQSAVLLYSVAKPDGLIFNQAGFFGFRMAYTATRKTLFYFDDIKLSEILPDETPPNIENITAIDAQHVMLAFDEAIDITSGTDLSNYKITNNQGESILLNSAEVSGSSVTISLNEPLQNGTYDIVISNIKDLFNNELEIWTGQFSFLQVEMAEAFDILINELMADPSPQIGLPDSEFIELWNQSDKNLSLKDCKLQKTSTLYPLPDIDLQSGDFIIIVGQSDVSKWNGIQTAIGIGSFPSLNNDGTSIQLLGPSNDIIHSVTYDLSSYGDNTKSSGGWSLEYNKALICDGAGAFRASTDVTGGTPGKINTNNSAVSPTVEIQSMNLTEDGSLDLCFNKILDFTTPITVNSFSGVNTPDFVLFSTPGTNCVTIFFDDELIDGQWYELQLNGNLSDCLGDGQPIDTIIGFGKGFKIPTVGDLIINEILFNPTSGGSDFIELYNKSQEIFDLKNLIILNSVSGNFETVTSTMISRPGSYTVICPNPGWLMDNYDVKNPTTLFNSRLPSFNDDAGNITISMDGHFLDSFSYDEEMHNPFLEDREGFSLERLNDLVASDNPSNWQSASSQSGGATPTYENSQVTKISTTEKALDAETKYFSPNNDGFNDQFILLYNLKKSGYALRWRVFDIAGRVVSSENQGILTGQSGFFTWDGHTDFGSKPLPGIYIIEAQFTHPDGETLKEKINCVVSYPEQ